MSRRSRRQKNHRADDAHPDGPSLCPLERRHVGATLLAITVVGLTLRLVGLGDSLWLDELHTSWIVRGNVSDVPVRATQGASSPPYFLLVWTVVQLLGHTEWTLRLLPWLAGVALIPTTYFVCRRFGAAKEMSLLASSLVALDRYRVYYSQEARPYALVQLLATVQVLLFWSVLRKPSRRYLGAWVLVTTTIFYLHYTTALLPVAECAFLVVLLLVDERSRKKYYWKGLLVAGIVTALLCIPAMPQLLDLAGRRENWAKFVSQRPVTAIFTLYPLHTYAFLPAAMVLFLPRRDGRAQLPKFLGRRQDSFVFCLCWLFIPLCLAWMANETNIARLFLRRYVIVASLAPVVITALLGSSLRERRQRNLYTLVVLSVSILVVSPVNRNYGGLARRSPAMEGWRDAIKMVRDQTAEQAAPVFVNSGLSESDAWYASENSELVEYCLFPIRGIYPVPDVPAFPLPRSGVFELSALQLEVIRLYPRLWLVVRGSDQALEATTAAFSRQIANAGGKMTVNKVKAFGIVHVADCGLAFDVDESAPTGAPQVTTDR